MYVYISRKSNTFEVMEEYEREEESAERWLILGGKEGLSEKQFTRKLVISTNSLSIF